MDISLNNLFFFISLGILACVFVICILVTSQRRKLHSAQTLYGYISCMFLWCCAGLCGALSSNEVFTEVCGRVGLFGLLSFSSCWIIFIIQNGRRINLRDVPGAILYWVALPGAFYFFSLSIRWNGNQQVLIWGGVLFLAAELFLGILILRRVVREGRMTVKGASLCTAALLLPAVGGWLHFAGILFTDLVPVFFILSCVALLIVDKGGLFDGLPPTRTGVLDFAERGVVVFNCFGQTMYANPMTYQLLEVQRRGRAGRQRVAEIIASEEFSEDIYAYDMDLGRKPEQDGRVVLIARRKDVFAGEGDDMAKLEDSYAKAEEFTQRIEKLITMMKSHPEKEGEYALAYIDIDNFTNVNRTVGRRQADALLWILSRRFADATGGPENVCRIRGDEFLLLFRSRDGQPVSPEQVGRRIQFATEVPFIIMEDEVSLSTSAGIGILDRRALSAEDFFAILHDASKSLSERGGNDYTIVTEEISEKTTLESILRRDLYRSCERGELQLLYQPQVGSDGMLYGFEALVRWNHPTQGVISPGEFIALAEESGEIIKIGKFVVEEAMKEWAQLCWSNAKIRELKLSINVCMSQLREIGFAKQVLTLTERYGLDPRQIHLEMTESMTLYDDKRVFENLNLLDQKGIAIVIDDFGMGYTSLRYIKMLPVSILKLDGMFSCDVMTNKATAIIVEAMAILCKQMNIGMIVEHVETKEQLDMLESLGCTLFQGYYFSRPVPASRIKYFIK